MTETCRYCHSPLGKTIVDLGMHPISNAFPLPQEAALERRFPLVVKICPECRLAQAAHDIPSSQMFTPGYVYFSSMSTTWVRHAERYADDMIARFDLRAGSLVVEVASNDGYLLQHFRHRGIPVLGVEPTASTAKVAREKGIPVEEAYFGLELAEGLSAKGLAADLMAANNVLAHVPDIRDFVSGFRALLKPDGVATFEFPHLLTLLRETQFDTIYHEHYSYLSLLAVRRIFEDQGLRIFDLEHLTTHGGSLRIFACRAESRHAASGAVDGVLAEERAALLDRDAGYEGFSSRVQGIKRDFLSFLEQAKEEGRTVAAYGAAAKGNTFLNACGIGRQDIGCVADRAPSKQNRLLPGSHVPVVTPEAMLARKPDYIVILPWNLKREISEQLEPARRWGARFVTAIPELTIF